MKTAKSILSFDQIRGASDIQTEEVAVPEWGGSVLVRGLTAKERDKYESSMVETKGKSAKVNMANARARLLVMTVVDESGELMFSQADVGWIGEKSAAAVDRIYDVASRLSGVTDADMDELVGNSSGQSDDSSSD